MAFTPLHPSRTRLFQYTFLRQLTLIFIIHLFYKTVQPQAVKQLFPNFISTFFQLFYFFNFFSTFYIIKTIQCNLFLISYFNSFIKTVQPKVVKQLFQHTKTFFHSFLLLQTFVALSFYYFSLFFISFYLSFYLSIQFFLEHLHNLFSIS